MKWTISRLVEAPFPGIRRTEEKDVSVTRPPAEYQGKKAFASREMDNLLLLQIPSQGRML